MRKNFYFRDKNVVKHIEKQRNQSQYIESLVKKDMNDEQDLLSYIQKLVWQYQTVKTTDTSNIEEYKDRIEDILDI